MATLKTIITLAIIATSSAAYADDGIDYQAQQQAADAQFQQATEMQQMQNQINSQLPPQQVYQQPQVAYQPLTTDTAYGTMYVGPGSGFTQP